jgi:hypothetical protein
VHRDNSSSTASILPMLPPSRRPLCYALDQSSHTVQKRWTPTLILILCRWRSWTSTAVPVPLAKRFNRLAAAPHSSMLELISSSISSSRSPIQIDILLFPLMWFWASTKMNTLHFHRPWLFAASEGVKLPALPLTRFHLLLEQTWKQKDFSSMRMAFPIPASVSLQQPLKAYPQH